MSPAHSTAAERERLHHAVPSQVLIIGKSPQLGLPFEQGLAARDCLFKYAAGSADALRRLRRAPYSVVVTDPATSVEEDLALLEEMRAVRPGVRVIVLAPDSTPEAIIAALRARVFLCKCAPFDADEIAAYAAQAATSLDSPVGIEVLSAHRDWISVRMNCQILNAERLIVFLNELQTRLEDSPRAELMLAFREILMNAIEHGGEFHSKKVVDVAAVHTARTIVFYVHDPGQGFRWEALEHAAVCNPEEDPTRHVTLREEKGLRPGGFGILMAKGVVNELIYSEIGNEVLLIKYTD
jgi:anti-sigma regulatory factor (Ser/Thr protein kinase)/ActR/RegA family two-component response regulator